VSTHMNLFEATKSIPKHGKVTWNKQRNLWQADFYIKGQKQKSYFRNEVDATKKLNLPNQQVTYIQITSFFM
jgi:hypothetical protein